MKTKKAKVIFTIDEFIENQYDVRVKSKGALTFGHILAMQDMINKKVEAIRAENKKSAK